LFLQYAFLSGDRRDLLGEGLGLPTDRCGLLNGKRDFVSFAPANMMLSYSLLIDDEDAALTMQAE